MIIWTLGFSREELASSCLWDRMTRFLKRAFSHNSGLHFAAHEPSNFAKLLLKSSHANFVLLWKEMDTLSRVASPLDEWKKGSFACWFCEIIQWRDMPFLRKIILEWRHKCVKLWRKKYFCVKIIENWRRKNLFYFN